MKTLPGCRCGALPWDCVCGDANEPAGFTTEGYPVNRDGFIAMDRCTPEQRRAINEAMIPNYNLRRKQAGELA